MNQYHTGGFRVGCPLISMVTMQVHGLDPDDWKKAEVIHIDIADRTQVGPKVGLGESPFTGQSHLLNESMGIDLKSFSEGLLGVSSSFVGSSKVSSCF